MSGIAALAAAAAATQKITTPTSGVKVVTPTIVTPSGIKVTPVQGRQGTVYFLLCNVGQCKMLLLVINRHCVYFLQMRRGHEFLQWLMEDVNVFIE